MLDSELVWVHLVWRALGWDETPSSTELLQPKQPQICNIRSAPGTSLSVCKTDPFNLHSPVEEILDPRPG